MPAKAEDVARKAFLCDVTGRVFKHLFDMCRRISCGRHAKIVGRHGMAASSEAMELRAEPHLEKACH